MSTEGQIRLSPRPPRCRSGASGSPPIPDSVAAAVRISGLCQSRTTVTPAIGLFASPLSLGLPTRKRELCLTSIPAW
jgi:hypothetical protein